VAAVIVMGLLLVLFQAVAPALGWIGGPVTAAPLLMQGLIYGLSLAALVGAGGVAVGGLSLAGAVMGALGDVCSAPRACDPRAEPGDEEESVTR
jgi:hypothetical protein